METQTCLSRHYKFILAKNITILSVSSDDFLHTFPEVAEPQMWNYSSYLNKKGDINQGISFVLFILYFSQRLLALGYRNEKSFDERNFLESF